ncbi:hypothetical protein [Sporocytophaga myxococcoides]|uniref:hypothetical protein n=1 Tax=Sporocytophaga myxococcoides TaxID=153721 RepID=UPI000419444D|nr:hypothetical protein [Sporocytophaga myxococcoides]
MLCNTEFSELISIEDETEAISITARFQMKASLPETIGLVTCIGIEFYELVAGKYYLVPKMSCMKIEDVF